MRGRPVAKWLKRKCKACGIDKPRADFLITRSTAKTGVATLSRCIDCRRRIDRTRKLEQYRTDPEYREQRLESNRRRKYRDLDDKQRTKACWYQGRYQWIDRRMARIVWWQDQPIIVCIKPSGRRIQSNERQTERTGYELAIIRDQPPINLPIGWRPALRIRGPIITRHPSCPAEWEWLEPLVERRYMTWKQRASGDAGQSDLPK
jgi:hypothetical protein